MATKTIIPLILILTLLGAVGYVRGGRPQSVHPTTQAITSMIGDGDGFAWVEVAPPSPDAPDAPPAAPGGTVYVLAKGADTAVCLYSEPHITDIALAGDKVIAIETDGTTGAVLSIPRSGGQPVVLSQGLSQPAGLAESDGTVYWTETRGSLTPRVAHIPAVSPRTTIYGTTGGAAPTSIAVIESGPEGFRGKLLGTKGDRVYWLERTGISGMRGWTAIRSTPVNRGQTETLLTQRSNANDAVLVGTALHYTSPSQDGGAPLKYRCVERMDITTGESETLTDWLPVNGELAVHEGKVYYTAPGGTWAVPNELAPPRLIGKFRASGHELVVQGRFLYEASEGGIVKLPLTLAGRYIAALGG